MPHQAESPSPAFTLASAASTRRKRVILLCSEDLRPIACSIEDALRSRGWRVTVEFGRDARPWVQKAPTESPSLRVLCVPGTVDRALAQQLRAAFGPDPDADLHILGVDDSRGLVQEIERLAGGKQPPRRSLHARPRLAHPTVVESHARRERGWLMGGISALAVFAITLGGLALAESGDASPPAPVPTASLTALPVASAPAAPAPSSLGEPIYAAAAVSPSFDDWQPAVPPEEDDFEIVIFDDEPEPTFESIEVVAPPLAEPVSAPGGIEIDALAPTLEPLPADAVEQELPELPPGFLPVAGLTVATPVVEPRPALTDPFQTASPDAASAPLVTVDPFASTDDGAQ